MYLNNHLLKNEYKQFAENKVDQNNKLSQKQILDFIKESINEFTEPIFSDTKLVAKDYWDIFVSRISNNTESYYFKETYSFLSNVYRLNPFDFKNNFKQAIEDFLSNYSVASISSEDTLFIVKFGFSKFLDRQPIKEKFLNILKSNFQHDRTLNDLYAEQLKQKLNEEIANLNSESIKTTNDLVYLQEIFNDTNSKIFNDLFKQITNQYFSLLNPKFDMTDYMFLPILNDFITQNFNKNGSFHSLLKVSLSKEIFRQFSHASYESIDEDDFVKLKNNNSLENLKLLFPQLVAKINEYHLENISISVKDLMNFKNERIANISVYWKSENNLFEDEKIFDVKDVKVVKRININGRIDNVINDWVTNSNFRNEYYESDIANLYNNRQQRDEVLNFIYHNQALMLDEKMLDQFGENNLDEKMLVGTKTTWDTKYAEIAKVLIKYIDNHIIFEFIINLKDKKDDSVIETISVKRELQSKIISSLQRVKKHLEQDGTEVELKELIFIEEFLLNGIYDASKINIKELMKKINMMNLLSKFNNENNYLGNIIQYHLTTAIDGDSINVYFEIIDKSNLIPSGKNKKDQILILKIFKSKSNNSLNLDIGNTTKEFYKQSNDNNAVLKFYLSILDYIQNEYLDHIKNADSKQFIPNPGDNLPGDFMFEFLGNNYSLDVLAAKLKTSLVAKDVRFLNVLDVVTPTGKQKQVEVEFTFTIRDLTSAKGETTFKFTKKIPLEENYVSPKQIEEAKNNIISEIPEKYKKDQNILNRINAEFNNFKDSNGNYKNNITQSQLNEVIKSIKIYIDQYINSSKKEVLDVLEKIYDDDIPQSVLDKYGTGSDETLKTVLDFYGVISDEKLKHILEDEELFKKLDSMNSKSLRNFLQTIVDVRDLSKYTYLGGAIGAGLASMGALIGLSYMRSANKKIINNKSTSKFKVNKAIVWTSIGFAIIALASSIVLLILYLMKEGAL